MYEGVVQDLIDELGRLPGVGPKSAQRIAFHLLQAEPADVRRLSDDLASIAIDLENGLRHFRAGDVDEALWWWQFSYVNNWGNLAGAALNALLTVVAHDRFDTDFEADADAVAVADEMLESAPGAQP